MPDLGEGGNNLFIQISKCFLVLNISAIAELPLPSKTIKRSPDFFLKTFNS